MPTRSTALRSPRRALTSTAVIAMLAAGLSLPGPVGASEVVVQDDAELLHRPTPQIRQTLRRLVELGTDRVRITAGWSALAPAPDAARPPRRDERGLIFYERRSSRYAREPMARLDRAIRLADAAGLAIQLDLAFWAPRWAVARPLGSSVRQRWLPDVRRYARFVEAIAERYSGGFDDPRHPGRRLPAVRQWTTWNEPNHPGFLLPQWERADGRLRPVAPHHYRSMHEAGYRVLKRVNAANEVLLGGLASRGGRRPGERSGIQPLRFLRELACVDDRLEPLTDARCRAFAPLRADGFAFHPYTFGTSPYGPSARIDEVGIGELHRLSALLGALQARGRIDRVLPLYLTEYGYETNPPDRIRGVSERTQARYHGLATFLAWQRPDVRMFPQFLVRDIGPDLRFAPGSSARYRDFQTGLFDVRGRAKPAVRAFRVPFWAYRDGGDAVLFGQVRPGAGTHLVRIEREVRPGRWEVAETRDARLPGSLLATGFETDARGYFVRRLASPAPTRVRARWLRPSGGLPVSIDLVVR